MQQKNNRVETVNAQPLVSVLMPVYNAEAYIAASLKSIVEQDYENLEIIIVDDGCTDQSMDIVQSFLDPRIVLVKNPENTGLAACLNKAIAISTGEFLARMDADDIAHPARIGRQVTFMLNHPDVDVLGTSMQYFGASRFVNHFPATHEACKSYLVLNVCFGHPSVMFRRTVFDDPANFYNPVFRQYSEEYDLWCRLADRYRFDNIREILLYYRTYHLSVKSEAENKRMANSSMIRKNYLNTHLGELTDREWELHCKAAFLNNINSTADVVEISKWFSRLLDRNEVVGAFNQDMLRAHLAERFFEVCYAFTGLGRWTTFIFYRSQWLNAYAPSFKKTIKFITKQFVKA